MRASDVWNDARIAGFMPENIFSKKRLEQKSLYAKKSPSKSFSHFAIMNQVLIVSTDDGSLYRTQTDPLADVDEVEISRRGQEDHMINGMYLNPQGNYVILSMKSGENYFLHEKSVRPRKLSRLNGLTESIAFDSSYRGEGSKTVLIGTKTGKLYEIVVDASGKEKQCLLLYSSESKKPITSLYLHRFDDVGPTPAEAKIFLFFAESSPLRLYHFYGGPNFQQCLHFDRSFQKNMPYTDLPGDKNGNIDVHFGQFSDHDRSLPFTILVQTGIYNGSFKFPQDLLSGDVSIEVVNFLPFSLMSSPSTREILRTAMTQFHLLCLYQDKLQAVSSLSGEIVEEITFRKDVDGVAKHMITDLISGVVWVQTDAFIYKIDIEQESRYTWLIYLKKAIDMGSDDVFFKKALQYSTTSAQQAAVVCEQATYLMKRRQYEKASESLLKNRIRFEESVLSLSGIVSTSLTSFSHSNARNEWFLREDNLIAVREYLTNLLKQLPPSKKHQRTMVASLIVDLLLHDIENEHCKDSLNVLREFLTSHRNILDVATTFSLIKSRNNRSTMLFYADIVKDYEKIVSAHISEANYREIIKIFFEAPVELIEPIIYKVSPILVEFEPDLTFSMLLSKQKLSFVNVLPTIVRYCNLLDLQKTSDTHPDFPLDVDNEGKKINFALRYLQESYEYTMSDSLTTDPQVVHALILIVAKFDNDPREAMLSGYLESLIQNISVSYQDKIDREYILRICKRYKRNKSLILAYIVAGYVEKAVDQAIKVDLELAISIAKKANNHLSAKRIWLRIARHFVEGHKDSKGVLRLLHESDGGLQIEDLLPIIPDFTEIDNFKAEICKSLQVSGDRIESLKAEMNELSESSESIMNELEGMKRRGYSTVTSQRCDCCYDQLFNRQFYLFPCSHTFHSECLLQVSSKSLEAAKLDRIRFLDDHLKNMSRKESLDKRILAQVELYQNEFDGLIAADCPLCGNMMIESLAIPLITESDDMEAKSWLI